MIFPDLRSLSFTFTHMHGCKKSATERPASKCKIQFSYEFPKTYIHTDTSFCLKKNMQSKHQPTTNKFGFNYHKTFEECLQALITFPRKKKQKVARGSCVPSGFSHCVFFFTVIDFCSEALILSNPNKKNLSFFFNHILQYLFIT